MSAIHFDKRRSIHSPEPEVKRSPLAPHHSVMEALNMNDHELAAKQLDRDLNFSTSSWQSIGEFLGPRPTSSVLSSDDTDDDGANEQVLVPAIANIGRNISLPSTNNTIELNDDEKTIEIDMNMHINSSSSTGSAFVMPQFGDDQANPQSRYYKILIIGNKKSNFFKMLDQQLRTRFTLDVNDSYNVILVIFDGLVKIGNILNFIKQSDVGIQEKLFIPIFRNINLKIIEKILKMYKIELLCSPIHYDNTFQVQHLLEFLNDDLLTQKSIMSDYDYDEFSNDPQSFNESDYQLIPINQDRSIDEYSSSPLNYRNQKSVIIKHHVIGNSTSRLSQSQTLSSLSTSTTNTNSALTFSKKNHAKESKRKRYFLLSISLSLGIGIGVASAYTISLFTKPQVIKHSSPPLIPSPSFSVPTITLEKAKQISTITLNGAKVTGSILKNNVTGLTDNIKNVSNFLWYEMKSAVKNVNCVWEHWIVNTGKAFYDSALLWSF